MLNMEALFGAALYKEVLRRRGVIASATMRGYKSSSLDALDHRELDVLMAGVEDLFTV